MIKSSPNRYDYIFTGAGCAGLSLLMQLVSSGKFADKRILLIDKAPKNTNDRTWCFWETEEGLFEPIVHKRWNAAWYHTDRFSRLLDLYPFQYKMIRGIDFYNYCFDLITQQPNFFILLQKVDSVFSENETGVISKSGAFLRYGELMLGQGREAAKSYLKENKENNFILN